MGDPYLPIRIAPLWNAQAPAFGPIQCLVDTGATLSLIPESALQAANIPIAGPTVFIQLADGRTLQRRTADLIIHIDGESYPSRTLVGEPGDKPLLGVTVLEMAQLIVDPVDCKVVKKGSYNLFRLR